MKESKLKVKLVKYQIVNLIGYTGFLSKFLNLPMIATIPQSVRRKHNSKKLDALHKPWTKTMEDKYVSWWSASPSEKILITLRNLQIWCHVARIRKQCKNQIVFRLCVMHITTIGKQRLLRDSYLYSQKVVTSCRTPTIEKFTANERFLNLMIGADYLRTKKGEIP